MDDQELLFNGKTAVVLYGRCGAGKTRVVWDRIGKLHKSDPEAIAIVIDTEYRHHQTPHSVLKEYGVDPDRLAIFEQNQTQAMIERIGDVMKFVEGGAPVRMLVISTVNGIATRRYNGDDPLPIGTYAQSLQNVLHAARALTQAAGVNLVLVCQVRADLAPNAPKRYLASPASALGHVDFKALVENGQITEIESTKEKP